MNQIARLLSMLATILFATSALAAAPRDGVEVRLSVPAPVIRGDVDVVVTVTVTNTARRPVNLLRWQLPIDDLQGPLFRITRDGEAVAYTGPFVTHAPPGPADRIRLDPGASLTYNVELTAAYDLSRNGRYAIEYASRGARSANSAALRSDTLYLWLEGRSASASAQAKPPGGGGGGSGNVTYTSCSSEQQTALKEVVATAKSKVGAAIQDLLGPTTNHYVRWFGAGAEEPVNACVGNVSSTRLGIVKSNFTAIQTAFNDKPVTIDCKCKSQAYTAYVYSNQPYKIYLCGNFWKLLSTTTDTKAGVLIHEMSHFNVVAGTSDHSGDLADAEALAITSPELAVCNADSYRYFAETSP